MYGVMVRTKCEVSAVCPVCQKDFTDSGKNRYGSLKRHIRSQHPEMPDVMNITNNTLNLNVNMHMMTPVHIEEVKKMVKQIIDEVNEDPAKVGNLCTFVFKTLHCNPGNPDAYVAAIPNVNKDEMIILEDGKAKVTTCKQGMNKVLYKMFDSEVETLSEFIESDTFNNTLVQEAQSGMCVPKTIEGLKQLPPSQRREMVRHLRSKFE